MRTITALIIPPDAPAYLDGIEATAQKFQSLVGGWIQAIGVNGEAVLYMNEEGKYEGLPVNPNANIINRHSDFPVMAGDVIVGTCFITGLLDPQGRADHEDHDVPHSVLDLCERAGVQVLNKPDARPSPS